MRILLALMIALPLLMAVSPEADAGLVDDLRSGESDIKAASSHGASHTVFGILKEQKNLADYKAIITKRELFGSIYYWSGYSSAEEAAEKRSRLLEDF